MKPQLLVLAIVLALAYAAPSSRRSGLLKTKQGCEGTQCPAGCCPNVGWYCCPDDTYCAATPADCPIVKKVERLASLATKKTKQGCEGTQCPTGCCPNVGWYCCPGGIYCTATPADCPINKKMEKLASLATKKKKECECYNFWGHCCPTTEGFHCCPDGYCAADSSDCPIVKKVERLASLVTKKTKQGCEGTQCPAGCCPNVGWYCCPDDTYCAATPADCPIVKKVERLASLATKKTKQGCEGTQCPAGCCPNVGWYCCPDDTYCAATPADCPIVKKTERPASLATKNTKECECYDWWGNCCHVTQGFHCCPDGYCQDNSGDCPFIKKVERLASLATKKTKQCEGTDCPGGCCPNVGWYCCPDGIYCAATPADCPIVKKVERLASLATKKTKQGCEGTQCPAGCCPNVGWYCCPDDSYCAATPADCPIIKEAERPASLVTKKTKKCECLDFWGHCCTDSGWYCCPDGYCSALESGCPDVKKVERLASIATNKKKQGCEGTQCPAGCCPNVGWYCCPDDTYCAATPADCPIIKKWQSLLPL